jgi:hypothetical protein
MTSCQFLILAAVVGAATFLPAQQQNSELPQQSQPTFKGHRVGEPAQEFFSIAKMADKNGMLSTDYCRSFLDQPKVKKAIEKAQKKGWDDNPSSLAVRIDVEGCNNVRAALAGKDVELDSRFASEFGDDGSMRFIAGHLALMRFVVETAFNNVVEDMTAKLNAKPQLDVATVQNRVAGIQKQHRAVWTLPNILAKIAELQSLEGTDIGTEVSVSSPATMEHRTNSLN